jgi:predicted O-methyltransferase YrrM
MLKKAIKQAFHQAGFKIERRDRLEESIPGDYNRSPFLPRIYRGSLYRVLYFLDYLQKLRAIEGDIVECGVSVGYGALLFLLLSDYVGVKRVYYGFDSFEGFPDPVAKDESTPIAGSDFYASPPETVLRVLRDGQIPESTIRDRVRLTKGFFNETLPSYTGKIALLHLDCDMYESYKVSLETLYDKVVTGGIIAFDEYDDLRWPGARKAIDEFFADKPEKIVPHEKSTRKNHAVKL